MRMETVMSCLLNVDFRASALIDYLCIMSKALAIDFGERRSGLAITDELQIIASPLEGIDTKEIWKKLSQLIASETISDLVVGDPAMFGEAADSSAAIATFVEKLKKSYPTIPVHMVDESFSSRDAMQAMVMGGMSKKKRRDKKTLDKISATVILQRWLDSKG